MHGNTFIHPPTRSQIITQKCVNPDLTAKNDFYKLETNQCIRFS